MLKLLSTITTSLIGKHEALFFDDGHLEIEEPMINFQHPDEEHVYERVCLDELEQYRLYLLLEAKYRAKEMHP